MEKLDTNGESARLRSKDEVGTGCGQTQGKVNGKVTAERDRTKVCPERGGILGLPRKDVENLGRDQWNGGNDWVTFWRPWNQWDQGWNMDGQNSIRRSLKEKARKAERGKGTRGGAT